MFTKILEVHGYSIKSLHQNQNWSISLTHYLTKTNNHGARFGHRENRREENERFYNLCYLVVSVVLLPGCCSCSFIEDSVMTASQTYKAMRIPSHQQQVFATIATWGNLYKRFGKATVEARRGRIEQAFRQLEAQLQTTR